MQYIWNHDIRAYLPYDFFVTLIMAFMPWNSGPWWIDWMGIFLTVIALRICWVIVRTCWLTVKNRLNKG